MFMFYNAGYFYKENENVGERRRVWASCQVDGYTDIAGGNSFRKKQGERMRFKTMHKIHDFKKDSDIICVLAVEDVMMPVRNTYHFQSV